MQIKKKATKKLFRVSRKEKQIKLKSGRALGNSNQLRILNQTSAIHE